MAVMPKNGKKGISLAYVMVAAMVLLILSGVLAAAAARNMSLTVTGTQSRQAYLTVKSAVEFAKGEAYRREKAGNLTGFSVLPDGALFKAGKADQKPDGKAVYALCTVGDDSLVTVSGKVAYGDRYRSIGCSFRLKEEEEPVSGIGAVNSFVAAGQRYGNNSQFLNGDYSFSGNPSSIKFPAVFQHKISTSNQTFAAPDMYFLNTDISYLYSNGGTGNTSLTADVLYFGGTIQSQAQGIGSTIRFYTYSGKQRGVVWFGHGVSVRTPRGSVTVPEGAYYFNDGIDLLDAAFLQNLEKISNDDLETDDNLRDLARKVAYYTENAKAIASSEKDGGIGWTEAGRMLGGSPAKAQDKDVFMYADKDVCYERWMNQNSPQVYDARSIVLHYNGESDKPFTIPKTTITFLADTLWLNGQSKDGAPGDDSDDDDVFAVRQASSQSRFVLQSHSGDAVLVCLPHGMVVKDSNGRELYSVSAGTYTVSSGTDLFQANEEAFVSRPSGGGSGGGSGEGGVTVSDLKYSDS